MDRNVLVTSFPINREISNSPYVECGRSGIIVLLSRSKYNLNLSQKKLSDNLEVKEYKRNDWYSFKMSFFFKEKERMLYFQLGRGLGKLPTQ